MLQLSRSRSAVGAGRLRAAEATPGERSKPEKDEGDRARLGRPDDGAVIRYRAGESCGRSVGGSNKGLGTAGASRTGVVYDHADKVDPADVEARCNQAGIAAYYKAVEIVA